MKRILPILVLLIVLLDITGGEAQIRQRKPYNQRNEKKKEESKDTSDRKKFKDHLTFGGNAWAAFGGISQVEIMPLVGYKVNENLQVGLGPSYVYRNYLMAVDYNTSPVEYGTALRGNSIFGGRVYVHYNVFRNFFVRGELEELSIPYGKVYGYEYIPTSQGIVANPLYTLSRRFVPATLLGGGLKNQMGPHSFAYIMLLYDLTWDALYSYQGNPYRIAVGFMF